MSFNIMVKYLVFVGFVTVVVASKINSQQQNEDNINLPSFFNSLASKENSLDVSLNDEPEKRDGELYAAYGVPPPPSSSIGISLNPAGLLEPHIEILKLVEAFMKLKGEVLGRVRALVTDNWDLIQGVVRLIVKKLENLHSFSLTGVSVIRKILEFAVNVFKSWSVSLPSVSISGAYGRPRPHPVYGLPSQSQGSSYGWNKK